MGTRLKNTNFKAVSRRASTKAIGIILFILTIIGTMLNFYSLRSKNVSGEAFFVKDYLKSTAYSNYVASAFNETYFYYDEVFVKGMDIGINNTSGYIYYITDGKKTYANTNSAALQTITDNYDYYYMCKDGRWTAENNADRNLLQNAGIKYDKKYTVYVAFPAAFLMDKQQQWNKSNLDITDALYIQIILFSISAILLIYLALVSGKRPEDEQVHLSTIDGLYGDILIAFALLPALIFASYYLQLLRDFAFTYNSWNVIDRTYSEILLAFVTVIFGIFSLVLFLSFVRRVKGKVLFKNTFIYAIFSSIAQLINGRLTLIKGMYVKQYGYIIISALLMFIIISRWNGNGRGLLFYITLELIITALYIFSNNKSLQQISKGFNESYEDQMKAERSKIALVTNVSHDLKTPLTSIISYVDLLSKEEALSDVAKDYIKVLAEKSNRLKNIVSDLFDLAKSTSGDIKLELEQLDLKKLIEQTLADMEGAIEDSGLAFKVKLCQGPVLISTDGKKLYRVFQNVLDNAIKYSHKGTRVYVELAEVDGRAVATIKNTASYEMNFSASEVLQRFNRGDKARTTEGSGLGLSIAESFTEVCGGSFNVEIDGDMFKVAIIFDTK